MDRRANRRLAATTPAASDKTDLSLILSALGLAVALGLGRAAAALLAGSLAGLLTARRRRGP